MSFPTTASEEPTPGLPAREVAKLSFEQLFVDHAPQVWRALLRLGVHPSDAEDVCQEVFLIIHRRLPTFEGRSSIQSWIYGICVRVTADYRKRAHRRYESPSDDIPEQTAPENQHAELEDHESRALLGATIDKLDADKRAVFVLFELEELPMTEVAVAVGCPLQTAYARLYAARHIVEAALRRATSGRKVT